MELSQPLQTGDFILSLATRTRSLENGILASGENLEAGTVLGQLTADGNYVQLDPAGADGSEVAVAVLHAGTNATNADTAVVVVTRDAEVKADALTWPAGITGPQQATAIGELNDRGIFLR